jgi:hypothetical protein
VRLELPDIPSSPDLAVDEEVLLERPPAEIPGVPYGFYDRIRSPSLVWLALIFGGLVVLLGRLRGLAALMGLAVSVVILLAFVIPAILEGSSPILVASVGAGAIGFVVLYLAHGFSGHTTVAVLGTLTGVGLTLVLSLIWTPLAKLSGLATAEPSRDGPRREGTDGPRTSLALPPSGPRRTNTCRSRLASDRPAVPPSPEGEDGANARGSVRCRLGGSLRSPAPSHRS